jgi:CBS-domain-containing membrane protein
MTTFTHTLDPIDLPTGARVLQPPRGPLERVTPDSPALAVMTDLAQVRLISVAPEASVDTAMAVMIHAKVRLLLVLDSEGMITGLVSAQDLMGEKPLRIASDQRVRHEEVRVDQVMTPATAMQPLDLADVQHATVRDIVRHLISSNRQHALVVTAAEDGELFTARGIFSLTQVARQLGEPLTLGETRAESFADLEKLIA